MSREILKWSVRILVLTSVGLCIGFDFIRLFESNEPSHLAKTYHLWDGWLTYAVVPDRGLFLKFDHFPAGDAGYAQNIYFRAVYDLYPQPLLATDLSKKISNGDELLTENQYPGDQWLRNHGVDSVMTIQMDAKRDLPVVSGIRWLGD